MVDPAASGSTTYSVFGNSSLGTLYVRCLVTVAVIVAFLFGIVHAWRIRCGIRLIEQQTTVDRANETAASRRELKQQVAGGRMALSDLETRPKGLRTDKAQQSTGSEEER